VSRRALTASVLAAGIVVGGATPALAGPADGRTKALEQEIAEYEEDQQVPDYQRTPDCCIVTDQPWGYADLILGVTMTVGAVVFFWS